MINEMQPNNENGLNYMKLFVPTEIIVLQDMCVTDI